ncbi:MAG: FliM/FliN family flagellar motor C-terminal domain-containing protein [Acidobacteriota bacterium]
MKAENENTIASWGEFLDLRLPLSVEIGRTTLSVREILELGQSSIVKLSRSTGEGVDVRVEDKPLLRGEIVVIEDRAGVRISQIITEPN